MPKPLAELLRPQTLNDMFGQQHLLDSTAPLAKILTGNKPQSMVLWGPPGTGKTTLANILINSWDCEAIKLSAVFSGIKEIKEALEQATQHKQDLFAKQVVLFIDEIHRFNKAQQDAFLHHLENGDIIIIGATTENPSFELNNALLSRLQVYVLQALQPDALLALLNKAITTITTDKKINKSYHVPNISEDAKVAIVDMADGDARRLLNILELVCNQQLDEVSKATLQQIIPNSLRRFDKGQDEFYNQISALHKSLRGSNADAALYWFMRMLDGGADPLYLGRRLLRFAWEDIGLANSNAATVVNTALQSYERLGSPEGELALANAVIYLATAKKSNSAYLAFNKVQQFVKQTGSHQVPLHLRNAPTKLMANLDYGKDYQYAHNYANHYVANANYWPDDLAAQSFYTPSEQGDEKEIQAQLQFLRNLDNQK